MSKVNVAFDGKPLFNWEGTAEEIQEAMKSFEALAQSAGQTPAALAHGVLKAIGDNGGNFLPTEQAPQMMAVMYTFLSQPTRHPRHPGYFRDHVGGWDFDINIHPGTERAQIEVKASWPAAGEASMGETTVNAAEIRRSLRETFIEQARWRREKAKEYPDDQRNLAAAQMLEQLASTVDDVDDATLDAYAELYDDLCDREAHSDLLRSIGFSTEFSSAADFVKQYIADRSGGLPGTELVNDFTQAITEVLQGCVLRNMKLPLILCAACSNGAVYAVRFRQGTGVEVLAEHAGPADMMQPPINILVVDQGGDALRAAISRRTEGITFH